MKTTKNKTKAILIALTLMLTITIPLFAILNANAQSALIMNLPGDEGVPHLVLLHASNYDIDLNGGPGGGENVSLFVRYPGRSSFTYIDSYLTRSNGDLDVYDFDFNETGDFQLKWALPPDFTDESNVEIARVVLEILRTTYPYLGSTPNPVGVGQETLLHIGITQQLAGVENGWEGLSVTITKPDGTIETISDIKTDSTGGTGRVYVPDQVGNYTLRTNFPKQLQGDITMQAATSENLTLVVLSDPIEYYPAHPMPTEYWTRPIDAQQREWGTIGGSWLVSTPDNKFVPFNEEAPDTAHILWTKPIVTGGVVGEFGEHAFECGDAYEGKWTSRFIIAGKLIYTHNTQTDPLEYTCVDLRTGEELWTNVFLDNRTISMGQLMYWDTYNYHGTYAYLWVTVGSTWYAYDPFDLSHRLTINNVPSGTTVVDPKDGRIYRASISTGQGRMTLWNMTALISMDGSFRDTNLGTYDAGASSSSARRAYSLNFTFPTDLPGSVQEIWLGDRFVGGSISTTKVDLWAVSLKPGQEGTLLFKKTWNAPAEWAEGDLTVSGFGGGWFAFSQEDKVAVLWVKELRGHYGFSLETGDYLWGPTEPQYYLDAIDDTGSDVHNIAYGKLYSASVSGICYCYDVQTGELLWKYEATDPYSEILWSNDWWLKDMFYTDGKIYLGSTEHSPIDPKPRGAPFLCLNATTGEEIWRINGAFRQTRWGGRAIIGDSVIATMDTYDQRVYAIGKGPSAITVEAPMTAVTMGSSLVIRGSVTDESPGTKSTALSLRFPNGVPAVSDDSMSEWMLYVYKQFPRPINAAGVEVSIDVIDSNGNYRNIGTATSDASGFYSLQWTPDIEGKYTVIATFAGSGGYYPSYAQTAFAVDEAAPTPAPTEAPLTSVSDMYFVPAVAGIIVAIAIGFAITILVLKKRP